MKVLVTGTAGFIGFHLAKRLINGGHQVIGLDCINNYYGTSIKYARLKETGIQQEKIAYNKRVQSSIFENYQFIKLRLEDTENMERLFAAEQFDKVVNLAAQAGVRYSLKNPQAYIQSNVVGFTNILECCRHFKIKHLVYASSSSVYGLNKKVPFNTKDEVNHPISLYAATKKSNELMAHTYSHLFDLPTTGVRFFTVYGPWGRPDMAYFLFTEAILKNKPIKVFNFGDMSRDFTYIDDIVEGIVKIVDAPAKGKTDWDEQIPDASCSKAPYKIFNIGNNAPVRLMDFINIIEKKLGKRAKKIMLPMQPGDVKTTYANVSDLIEQFNYHPNTSVEYGVEQFVNWYLKFYQSEPSIFQQSQPKLESVRSENFTRA